MLKIKLIVSYYVHNTQHLFAIAAFCHYLQCENAHTREIFCDKKKVQCTIERKERSNILHHEKKKKA